MIPIAPLVIPITASIALKSASLKSDLCGQLDSQPQRTCVSEAMHVNQERMLKSSFSWGKKTAG